MPDERRQFAILYRGFLLRIIDPELLSARGDVRNLLGQLGALLAAFSFVLAIVLVPRYTSSGLPKERLLRAAWSHEEFLIATSIATAGLFAVLAWNSMLLDRRDRFVLGTLPVHTCTIFAAKIAAMGTALAVGVIAVNTFTGLTFPFAASVPDSGPLGVIRSFAAYWITMFAAGLFMFCALLALQGLAAQLFPYRLFLRVSGFLQLAAFFSVLGIYFLTPAPTKQNLLAWLPSFWFLGLFQELNGPLDPIFGRLAIRAATSLLLPERWGSDCIPSLITATCSRRWNSRILHLEIDRSRSAG